MNQKLLASILSVMLITVQSQATIEVRATRTSADVFLCASRFAHNPVGWNTAEPRAQERANRYASARSMLLDIVAWDRYNNVRLHSAIGYVTPNDMLAGRQAKIHAERDRKLEAARLLRKSRRQQAA